MFGLWYELITAKFITMAYQLNIINYGYDDGDFLSIWTTKESEMLLVDSLDGLELLVFAGYLEWHYIFSMLFGMVACVAERTIASMLIDNYETSTSLVIPVTLTLLTQSSALPFAYFILTYKIGVVIGNLTWIIVCSFSVLMFFLVKYLNETWHRQMQDPKRKVSFTVSQRFQVKENLRAFALAHRVCYVVMGVTVTFGSAVIAQCFDLIPPFLCHFAENVIFLNPLPICSMTMYSLPAWKQHFLRSFPSFQLKRAPRKVGVASVEPIEDSKKKLDKETNIYFEQLNKSWI